ncbi:hypothetical protein QJS04_geneDACA010641 [Acorus gramineus]|uniref:MSP domain-containing protein n=1 Tax=Acorus gramineus TaxID=55184 RepID=A0AAV9AMT7_ACOGR|nr:hypothetical protein QJS04_geneDACA010641 [Acorus gramineus]
MEKLVEVSDQEIWIDFKLNTKCRAKVTLKSLHPTSPISFKVQTSAPHKFLVSPPTGLLPPLSAASFHVILRPQPSVPHSFPRSPSDRFLIKTAIAAAANLTSTYDVKLRVVYVGLMLLRHAVSSGNAEAVRDLLRRQRSLVSDLERDEAAELVRAAGNRKDVLDALFEAGLRRPRGKVPHGEGGSNGWSAVHATAVEDKRDAMAKLIERLRGGELDARDREGRTAVHLAAGKGHVRMVRMLVEGGADKDARSGNGWTAMHRAAANGDLDMVVALLEMGADCEIPTVRGQTPLDVARDKGHREIVEMFGRGEIMLTAARRGDMKLLESLLRRGGGGTNGRDQYGMTALHTAAIKGHRDAVRTLIDYGADLHARDREGHTPLHLAVEGGSADAVEALVDKGADVNARTGRGATPLYMARSMGHEGIAQLLLANGAASSSSHSSPSSSSP